MQYNISKIYVTPILNICLIIVDWYSKITTEKPDIWGKNDQTQDSTAI